MGREQGVSELSRRNRDLGAQKSALCKNEVGVAAVRWWRELRSAPYAKMRSEPRRARASST